MLSDQIAKYGSPMLLAPGKKFSKFYRLIKYANNQHSLNIKEILVDKRLLNNDKLELLKIKFRHALKNIKSYKRKHFVIFVIASLLFSVNGDYITFN